MEQRRERMNKYWMRGREYWGELAGASASGVTTPDADRIQNYTS